MRDKRARLSAKFSAIFLLLTAILSLPTNSAQAADCCKCIAPDVNSSKACIQITDTSLTCTSLDIKSKHPDVQALNCSAEPLTPTQCKPIAENGLCDIGPVSETAFKLPPGATSEGGEGEPVVTEVPLYVPSLNVPIPNLEFATILQPTQGILEIPFLAQYIAAAAQYLVGISIIAAAIMIVYGGFLYITGNIAPTITRGKEIIRDAIIGLVIILGSYTILTTINPETLTLKALGVKIVKTSEEAWIEKYGSADAVFSQKIKQPEIQGVPTEVLEDVVPITIDYKEEYEDDKGGPFNMNKFCASAVSAQLATTYSERIQLLVRAVLGWKYICIDRHQCAYCQTCATSIPGGSIGSFAGADFVLRTLKDHKMIKDEKGNVVDPARQIFRGGDCLTLARKGAAINNVPECAATVQDLYNKLITKKMEAAKIFGSDCWGFVTALINCTHVRMNPLPIEKGSPFVGEASFAAYHQSPSGILAAHMDQDLMALAAKKGGLRFGDLVYINGANEQRLHWAMYTGGRPDVPFSFIEMGGSGTDVGGASVPGIPGWMGGVSTWPRGKTIQDYVDAHTDPKKGDKRYDPKKGMVFVWRPFDYEKCGSKADCRKGEACSCTQKDSYYEYPKNKCNYANICHSVKTDGFRCLNDEHCAAGSSCVKVKVKGRDELQCQPNQ
ncbi:hypothetical protein KKF59_04140 [Patescibacteria group bacterium]|nr:hypothetical protein [Patescibacteria group bacterium]